mgnify:FL=1
MALKSTSVTIEKGRDKGKRFFISEMPVRKLEWWALRLILSALGNDGIDQSKESPLMLLGSMGVGILTKVKPADAKPLMDEMLDYMKILPNPTDPTVQRHIDDDDIEDLGTLFKLRAEWFKLHMDFLASGEE